MAKPRTGQPEVMPCSSALACTQAVLAAEVGHVELAYDYVGEAARMDLRDVEQNTRDGVHIASLAGAWIAARRRARRDARPRRSAVVRAASPESARPAGFTDASSAIRACSP
jgi:hypothetical protein